jgi:hypothetical protein
MTTGAGRGRLCADGVGWVSSVIVCHALRGAVGRVEADNGGQHWQRQTALGFIGCHSLCSTMMDSAGCVGIHTDVGEE